MSPCKAMCCVPGDISIPPAVGRTSGALLSYHIFPSLTALILWSTFPILFFLSKQNKTSPHKTQTTPLNNNNQQPRCGGRKKKRSCLKY